MRHLPRARAIKRPAPVRESGQWLVDLRAWNFGRRIPLGPESLSEVDAIHLAYAKLDELRRVRLAEPGAQQELRARDGAPELFAEAIDRWAARRKYRTAAGEIGAKNVQAALRRELGAYRLAEFEGTEGEDRLLAYLNNLSHLGAVTVRWRFAVISSVITFATKRGWLRNPPPMPVDELPALPAPNFDFTDEPTFRRVRAAVFSTVKHSVRAEAEARGETVGQYVARRRVGMSLLLYLGLHPRDVFGDPEFVTNKTGERVDMRTKKGFVAGFTDANLGLDVGVYVRQNSKSARVVPVEQFELPEPLTDDLRGLLAVLGREAFRAGERIAGGAWPKCTEVMTAAAERIGVGGPAFTARLLRKTYAREMFKHGYSVKEVSDRMGHVSTLMLQAVYARTPRPLGSAKTRWLRAIPGAPVLPHSGARVVPFHSQSTPKTTNHQRP